MRAIGVSVYRSDRLGDCTNGGVSSKYNRLLVICDRGPIDVDENNLPENLMKVVKRELFGRTLYHLEPVAKAAGVGWLSGGNFAASSDSRFSELVDGMYGAVAIHDRTESRELYDLLSR